jgi:hypothetical protein
MKTVMRSANLCGITTITTIMLPVADLGWLQTITCVVVGRVRSHAQTDARRGVADPSIRTDIIFTGALAQLEYVQIRRETQIYL